MRTVVELRDGLSLVPAPPAGAGASGVYPTRWLQRGLLLFDGDVDLAEEGVGFGVPVLKRGLQTVFPGGAAVDVHEEGPVSVVRSVYRLDLVERLAGADGRPAGFRSLYAAKDVLAALHRRLPPARGVLTGVSNALRRGCGWETTYVPVGTVATIPVTTAVDRRAGTLRVTVDLGGLPASVTEAAVMNELGARAFDRYQDAGGRTLEGAAIGTWDEVGAAGGTFVSRAHGVAFSLAQVEGATLRRGRELIGDRLSWAGFGLTVSAGRASLSYELRVARLP